MGCLNTYLTHVWDTLGSGDTIQELMLVVANGSWLLSAGRIQDRKHLCLRVS